MNDAEKIIVMMIQLLVLILINSNPPTHLVGVCEVLVVDKVLTSTSEASRGGARIQGRSLPRPCQAYPGRARPTQAYPGRVWLTSLVAQSPNPLLKMGAGATQVRTL